MMIIHRLGQTRLQSVQTPSDSVEPIGESSLHSGLVSCSGVSTSARYTGPPVHPPPCCMLVYGGSEVYLVFCNKSISLYRALSVMAISGDEMTISKLCIPWACKCLFSRDYCPPGAHGGPSQPEATTTTSTRRPPRGPFSTVGQ